MTAFSHSNFTKVFLARAGNTLASQILHVVVGWEIYRITGDPLALGLVGLAQFLPNFLFFLLTGLAADRLPRQLLLAGCFATHALATLVLMSLLTADTPSLSAVLATLFVTGAAKAFGHPTGQALIPNVVAAEHFPNAIAWMSSATQLAVIVGPALGGLLLLIGVKQALSVVIAMQLAAALASLGVRDLNQRRQREPFTAQTLLAGFRFVREKKIILGAISLDLFAVLLGGVTALLPIFASDILEVGEIGLGALRSSIAVGAAICALLLTRMPIRRHTGPLLFWTVALFGLATIIFGLSQSFWLSLAALFVAGAADMISVFIRETLVQIATPDEMRGRVSAVNTMFIGASNELGEFESGAVAALVGVVPSVLIGGIGTVLIAGLWAKLFPQLRQVDSLDASSLQQK